MVSAKEKIHYLQAEQDIQEMFWKKKKRKKKRKCLFGGTVPLKTNQYFFFFEPNVLCLGKENKKHHLRSFLTLYTLNWPGKLCALFS